MRKHPALFLLAAFLVVSIGLPTSGQEAGNDDYFARYHERVGRPHSLRRIGPDEMYRARLAGPEYGRAEISPTTDVVAGSFGTWEITYTAGSRGLGPGDALNIYIPYGFNPPLLLYPSFPRGLSDNYNEERSRSFSPGVTTVSTSSEGTELILYSSIRDYSRLSEGTNLHIGIQGEPLREGDRITVTYGDTTWGGPGASVAYFAQDHEFTTFVLEGMDWERFEQMVDEQWHGRAAFHETAGAAWCLLDQPALHVVGGEATALRLTAPTVVVAGEPFDLHLLPVDRLGNESASYNGNVSFEPFDGARLPGTCTVGGPGGPQMRLEDAAVIGRPGIYRLRARDTEHDLTAVSNPVRVVRPGEAESIFWGDLHVHSFESDGIGSPDWCNRFCRDIAALDFACICDHGRGVRPTIRQSAVEFTEPGEYLSFSGFEGLAGDMPGGGHVNFYFRDHSPEYEEIFRERAGEPGGFATREEVWQALLSLGERRVIGVPHNHNQGGWDSMDSPVIRLNEVYSVWGNSEYTGTPEKAYRFGHTTYRTFRDGLALGLEIGAIAAGDEHSGRGGTGSWLRHYRANSCGITAVMADELTLESVFEALWERRVYATTGARILLDFTVDGAPMGSRISKSGRSREVVVRVEGTEEIDYVAVLRNNEEILRKPGTGGAGMRVNLTDSSPLQGPAWYYARVVQRDSHVAWTSPVWVSEE